MISNVLKRFHQIGKEIVTVEYTYKANTRSGFKAFHTLASSFSSSKASSRTYTFSLAKSVSSKTFANRIASPPITYITGEEYSRYACELYLENWIRPYMNIDSWEVFDLSCKNREETNDQVIENAIKSGEKIGAIFKEPTITPNEVRVKKLGLKVNLKSPNAIFREAWNGTSISRDTIHIKGLELGYKNKVIFDRHAIGGEYSANYTLVGAGKVVSSYIDSNGTTKVVDQRTLTDDINAVVSYTNPYDNIGIMVRHFFTRCLENHVTPYIVTKKTVFKWQEPFWKIAAEIFNKEFKTAFTNAGLMKECRGELNHLLSDVATMRIVRWSNGGFGMCSLNYDGDVLTDEIAQVHRSLGFLTSVLNGFKENGTVLKAFEASHGTVTRMWKEKLRGKETSLNPLSLIEAMLGAIEYSSKIHPGYELAPSFTHNVRKAVHQQMAEVGKATRDISGPTGLNTEEFVHEVKARIDHFEEKSRKYRESATLSGKKHDSKVLKEEFNLVDKDGDGQIGFEEFQSLMKKLGAAPILGKKKSHL